MNIKKALLVTLSTGLIATTLVNTNYASAEDTSEPGRNAESEVQIKFEVDKGLRDAVTPVNPREPWNEHPRNPEEEGNLPKEQVGPLAIDYVTNIEFGDQTINKSEDSYKAETKEPYVQITDERFSGGGWHVSAKVEKFSMINEEDNDVLVEDSLPGAIITLSNGEAASTIKDNTLESPEVSRDINLLVGDDNSQLVASADSKEKNENMKEAEGLGTWVIRWLADENADENENVTLNVPKGLETPGTHTTTINWTLSDGPSDNHDTLTQTEND